MTDADMIEAMKIAIGPHFIGNRMPDMSGDPLRKATPYERRRIDEAVTAALAVVQPELDRLRAENARLREVQLLWCCHVRGPDEVHAARDYDHARKMADDMTLSLMAHRQKNPPHEYDPIITFAPMLWPWSAAAHAEDLKRVLADEEKHAAARAALSAPALAGEGR